MALKLKFRTLFPANVTASSPLTLVKTGLRYAFGFDVGALQESLDPLYVSVDNDLSADPIFAFEGDSITNIAGTGVWPLKLGQISAFFTRGTSNYYATGNDTATTMVGEYATQAGSVSLAPGQEAYFFLLAGTNDLGAAYSAGTSVSVASAALYVNLKALWALARASGYKVVAFTLTPRADVPAVQPFINATNTLILSDATLYDKIVRPELVLNNPTDSILFNGDHLHPSAAGQMVIAQLTAAAVLGTAPQYVDCTPTDNLIINGGIEVDQENAGALLTMTATGTLQFKHLADGFVGAYRGSFVATSQQVTSVPDFPANNMLKIIVTTAQASLGANDELSIMMPIEGYRVSRLLWGLPLGLPVSFGFWFYSGFHTGVFSGSVMNFDKTRCYPFSFTVSAAGSPQWVSLNGILPDTGGTWGKGSGVGLYLTICLAGGTSRVGTPNAWGTTTSPGLSGATGTTNGVGSTSSSFGITNVIAIPGMILPPGTKAALLIRPAYKERAEFERYLQYIRSDGATVSFGAGEHHSTTATTYHVTYNEMRAIPTPSVLTAASDFQDYSADGSATALTALVGNFGGTKSYNLIGTVAAVTAGRASILRSANANAALKFDARLI